MRFSRDHVEVDNENFTELVVLDIIFLSIANSTKTRNINVDLQQLMLYEVDVERGLAVLLG